MKRIFWSFFCFLLLTIAILYFVFTPLAYMIVEPYFQNQLNAYYRRLVKGEFHMVHNDLRQHAEDQWPGRIAAIAPHYGFPLNLKPSSEIDLNTEERQQLSENTIVVRGNGDMFYQKVRRSDWVIVLGPMEAPKLNSVWLEVIMWGACLLIIGLLTLLWALPFGRKLHKIITAALAFGDGRLETRTTLSPRSVLAPLADAFNCMADRIQQLINTQKELTNAVSHELRTPISRIRFSLEMLQEAAMEGDQKHYLSEITKDVEELEELVSESLTYAGFEYSTPHMEWQSRVLAPWLEGVAHNAVKGHRHLVLKVRNRFVKPDCEVYFEPRYMRRAVGNLIQNAVNYAENRVEVTMKEDGKTCLIHVDDDGPGIAVADRSRVFQAFTRLDESRNRKSGGYGLGLAIVHRVVRWHHGSTRVSDAPLGGTRMTISWPGFSARAPIEK